MAINNDTSVFAGALLEQNQQDDNHRITLELGLVCLLFFSILAIRIRTLDYNTLFFDEAMDALIGENWLAGVNDRNTLTFHLGSYLYPIVSATLNHLGGVIAMRAASAIANSITAVLVFLTTRTLFGKRSALLAMMLFGFMGINIKLSQLATFDSLALPFLAASLFFIVRAIASSPQREASFLKIGSIFAILATLTKYINLIYLPALLVTAFILFLAKGIPFRQAFRALWLNFILPIIVVLGFYISHYWAELSQLILSLNGSITDRRIILQVLWEEIGIITLASLIGLILLAEIINIQGIKRPHSLRQIISSTRPSQSRLRPLLVIGSLLLLFSVWLAAPLLHWLMANVDSLWQNCVYSLLFLCPLAGFGLTMFVGHNWQRNLTADIISTVITMLLLFFFVNSALDSLWSFQRSWPNVNGIVHYLEQSGLNESSRVLAEGMHVYQFYFDSGLDDRSVWNNFWHMQHDNLTGQEGAIAAIQDHVPDFVIIENYYIPSIRERTLSILAESGYEVGWSEVQELRSGESLLLQVFIKSKEGIE